MTVVATTKIVDNGADAANFVVVIACDGFTAAELPAFDTATQGFLARLQSTPPYDNPDVWGAMNFYRMDVTSPQSGANNPLTCPDDLPTYTHTPPEFAITEYGAGYCILDPVTGDGMRRLLELVDEQSLLDDVTLNVPAWDAVVCAVNHQEYGGSGG